MGWGLSAPSRRPLGFYAWSLPLRTLDPQLALLTRTLDGPAASTWVARWDDSHMWGLDPGDRVEAALHTHYRAVGYVCGHVVWLHDGIHRPLPPSPDASTCGIVYLGVHWLTDVLAATAMSVAVLALGDIAHRTLSPAETPEAPMAGSAERAGGPRATV